MADPRWPPLARKHGLELFHMTSSTHVADINLVQMRLVSFLSSGFGELKLPSGLFYLVQ